MIGSRTPGQSADYFCENLSRFIVLALENKIYHPFAWDQPLQQDCAALEFKNANRAVAVK